MVIISQPTSIPQELACFHTTDPLLSDSPILAFYGPSTTSVANPANNSRIQCHIFTPAGLKSYPRLAISPSSPLYQAVLNLSREEQGDEVCRGLAFSLLKYFSELPETAKDVWRDDALSAKSPTAALKLFSDSHAASLASRMQRSANGSQVIEDVNSALAAQCLSYLDVDLTLPAGSISSQTGDSDGQDTVLQDDDTGFRYGRYASIVKLFGEPVFMPTSKIRRAPSKTTSISHSATFSRSQKEKVRREMRELADTEARYVQKVDELVHEVARDCRAAAKSSREDMHICHNIFPKCVDEILKLNAAFLVDLEHVMSFTEEEALRDIESSHASIQDDLKADQLGILRFSQVLSEWLPHFSASYSEYLQMHAQFATRLKHLTQRPSSSLSNVVSILGEKKLNSLLIEPIQRLPRYSLYLDNIIKQLPTAHPAIKPLLAAKDTITNICVQESASSDDARLARLQEIVRNWPTDLPGSSRLVAAVDAYELQPPYNAQRVATPTTGILLLLFTKQLVVLQRQTGESPSARSLMSRVDAPMVTSNTNDDHLRCTAWWPLSTLNFSELDDGKSIMVSPAQTAEGPTSKMQTDRLSSSPSESRVFMLQGTNEGKAAKWSSDVAKSRIEDRYSEAEREGSKWEVRSFEPTSLGLSFVTAICEDSSTARLQTRSRSAPLRIILEAQQTDGNLKPGRDGCEILAHVSVRDHGFFQLEVTVPNERPTRDMVTASEFMPVLVKRVTSALQMRSQIRNPLAAQHLYHHYHAVLKSTKCYTAIEQPSRKGSIHHSHSPVKALTGLFSHASSKEGGRSTTQYLSPVLTDVTHFEAVSSHMAPTSSSPTRTFKHGKSDSQVTLVEREFDVPNENPLKTLETTLSSYVLALRARKGNVVGKILARRGCVPEAEVNELYNILLSDPNNVESAAQVSVDILFAAFEKFLKTIWKQKMGPVVSKSVLEDLEAVSAMYITHNFQDHFNSAIGRLAPQNQRALRSIVDLLSELLSCMALDSDKGVLTAAFAEILVDDGDPRDFIPLLDQLMYNKDAHTVDDTQRTDSIASFTPVSHRALQSSSFSTKAASISKKFGFRSMRRENSKPDMSFTGSMRRTWSTKKTSEDISARPDLPRNHSSDESNKVLPIAAQTTPQDSRTYNTMKRGITLDPISVSPFVADIDPFSSPGRNKARPISTSAIPSPSGNSSVTRPSPTKQPRPMSMYATVSTGSPRTLGDIGQSSILRHHAVSKSMDTPPAFNGYHTMRERPSQLEKIEQSPKKEEKASTPSMLPIPERRQHKSPSPGLRGILCERQDSGNTPPQSPFPFKLPSNTTGSPTKKLRIKSPQKPRVEPVIPVDMASQSCLQEIRSITTSLASIGQRTQSTDLGRLAGRLQVLESSLPALLASAQDTTALATATRKAKLLDAQLVKAHAENSILYDRANKEVMGVFEQLQAGHGVDELRRKLAEEMEESKRWREEAKKLARENAKLKARMIVESANDVRIVSELGEVPLLQPAEQKGTATPEESTIQHEDETASISVKLEQEDDEDQQWRENLPSRRDDTIRARKGNVIPAQQENMPPPPPRKHIRDDSPTRTSGSEERTMSMLGRGRPRRDDGTATMR